MPKRERVGWSRRGVGALVLGISIGLAACSSGPSGGTATTAPTTGTTHTAPVGRAVLGASLGSWEAAHPAVTVGTTSGYGSTVVVNGRKVPEFTSLVVRGDKVAGWHMSFGPDTRPAVAEDQVRDLLPADAQQTASWTAPSAGSGRYCEFVNFRSTLLGAALGKRTSPATAGDIGVSLYDRAPVRSGGPTTRVVNSADVGTRARVYGQKC